MPTLADIYSAADSFKRRLADAASNPSGALSQMLGYANDRARGFNELSSQAANEFQQRGGGFANQGPAGQALDQAYMEAGQVPAMTVWHGSPHVFESFDLGKLGSGEGGQAFGKGAYMAEMPEVAKSYMNSGKSGFYEREADKLMFNKTLDEAIESAQKSLNYVTKNKAPQSTIDESNEILSILQARKQGKKEFGNLYKVDLPDTHVRRMLDWDAPIKDQPYPVRNLAKKLGMDMNDLGGDLIGQVGKGEEGKQMLQQAGIPGIKYLGQERGNTGRNFVVFDPNHLTILERNAKPIK